jgi:sugar (pentulose or hexulose) kinase
VFGVYAVYEVMREYAGDASRLLLTGGLTKAPIVRTLLADVFALPAVQPHQEEASAFGAALVAAQAIGLVQDSATAARAVGYDAPTLPDRSAHEAYQVAFRRYQAFVEAHLNIG